MNIEQWDIIRFRISPDDRDLHPGVVISPQERCFDPTISRLNVLACSKRVPADGPRPSQVILNGADGLKFQTTCGCDFYHVVSRDRLTKKVGRVSPVRRRAIGRKLNEVFRLPL